MLPCYPTLVARATTRGIAKFTLYNLPAEVAPQVVAAIVSWFGNSPWISAYGHTRSVLVRCRARIMLTTKTGPLLKASCLGIPPLGFYPATLVGLQLQHPVVLRR